MWSACNRPNGPPRVQAAERNGRLGTGARECVRGASTAAGLNSQGGLDGSITVPLVPSMLACFAQAGAAARYVTVLDQRIVRITLFRTSLLRSVAVGVKPGPGT